MQKTVYVSERCDFLQTLLKIQDDLSKELVDEVLLRFTTVKGRSYELSLTRDNVPLTNPQPLRTLAHELEEIRQFYVPNKFMVIPYQVKEIQSSVSEILSETTDDKFVLAPTEQVNKRLLDSQDNSLLIKLPYMFCSAGKLTALNEQFKVLYKSAWRNISEYLPIDPVKPNTCLDEEFAF